MFFSAYLISLLTSLPAEVRESLGKDPVEVFTQAMDNIMPSLEVKARRVGGANYQVPVHGVGQNFSLGNITSSGHYASLLHNDSMIS